MSFRVILQEQNDLLADKATQAVSDKNKRTEWHIVTSSICCQIIQKVHSMIDQLIWWCNWFSHYVYIVAVSEYASLTELEQKKRLEPECELFTGGLSTVSVLSQTMNKADIYRGFQTVIPHFNFIWKEENQRRVLWRRPEVFCLRVWSQQIE